MTACASGMESLPGLRRIRGFIVMTFMAGFNRLPGLQGMVARSALGKAETGMHLMIECDDTEPGIELDNSLVCRNNWFRRLRTAGTASQNSQNHDQGTHVIHLLVRISITQIPRETTRSTAIRVAVKRHHEPSLPATRDSPVFPVRQRTKKSGNTFNGTKISFPIEPDQIKVRRYRSVFLVRCYSTTGEQPCTMKSVFSCRRYDHSCLLEYQSGRHAPNCCATRSGDIPGPLHTPAR